MPADDEYPRNEMSVARGPSGLGGWLVLPILGLIVTFLTSLAALLTDYIPLFRSGAWSALTDRGSSSYHAWWAPTILFEVFVCAVTIVAPVALLSLMFRKRPILPKLVIGFYAFVLFATIIDAVAVVTFAADAVRSAGFPDLAGTMGIETSTAIMRTVFASAIWIPYFLVSKRVANTFAADMPTVRARRVPRRILLWVTSVLLAGDLAGVGVLTWKAATLPREPEATAWAPGGMRIYTDPEYGYNFEYPADWVLQDLSEDSSANGASSYIALFDYNGAASGLYALDYMSVAVFELDQSFQDADLAGLRNSLEALYADAAVSDPDLKTLEALAPVALAGLKGFTATFTSTVEGIPITYTQYTLAGGDLEYDLTLQAATEDWARCRVVFDDFVKSFTVPAR